MRSPPEECHRIEDPFHLPEEYPRVEDLVHLPSRTCSCPLSSHRSFDQLSVDLLQVRHVRPQLLHLFTFLAKHLQRGSIPLADLIALFLQLRRLRIQGAFDLHLFHHGHKFLASFITLRHNTRHLVLRCCFFAFKTSHCSAHAFDQLD